MKIICTEHEKKILISAIRESTGCYFANRAKMCNQGLDCDECVEKSIEWDVKKGDGDG